MTKYNNTPLTLIFLACIFMCSNIHASNLEESQSKGFSGIRMRSGIGNGYDGDVLVERAQEAQRRELMRAVAHEAKEKAGIAQVAFAFQHNFLVPKWLQALLPEGFSSVIPQIETFGINLMKAKTLDVARWTAACLLVVNGFGKGLDQSLLNPRAKLVSLINEVGFKEDDTPLESAKHLVALALRLESGEIFGLSALDVRHLRAALFAKAADTVLSQAPHVTKSEEVSAAEKIDLYLSAAQLKLWSIYQQNPFAPKVKDCVDVLHLFEKAGQITPGVDEKSIGLATKLKSEHRRAYDFFGKAMLASGAKPAGVQGFIALQLQRWAL